MGAGPKGLRPSSANLPARKQLAGLGVEQPGPEPGPCGMLVLGDGGLAYYDTMLAPQYNLKDNLFNHLLFCRRRDNRVVNSLLDLV